MFIPPLKFMFMVDPFVVMATALLAPLGKAVPAVSLKADVFSPGVSSLNQLRGLYQLLSLPPPMPSFSLAQLVALPMESPMLDIKLLTHANFSPIQSKKPPNKLFHASITGENIPLKNHLALAKDH